MAFPVAPLSGPVRVSDDAVYGVCWSPPPRGGAVRPSALVVDGESIAIAPRDDTLHLCASGAAAWAVCFRSEGGAAATAAAAAAAAIAADGSAAVAAEALAGEWAFELRERGPHNAGPMRAVTAAPFAVVYGTQSASPAATEALLRGAQLLSQGHSLASHAFAPVVADVDVKFCEEGEGEGCLPCGTNLVLLGGPAQNSVTARLHAEQRERGFAVRFPGGGASAAAAGEPFAIGDRVFAGNATALLAAVGWADERKRCAGSGGAGELFGAMDARASPARLALVVAGTDADGLFAALRFAAPVIPPMVRAPYSNLFPDVLVLGPRVLREGYGGVLLAGYFGSRWELDEVASFAV